jgi:phosphoglycerate dehydrogenase-like enzyme
LRWVQLNTAAVDGVLNQPIARTEVQIANVKGAYSVAVAECAIGMLLAVTRRIPVASEFQSQRRWPQDYSPFLGEDLFGSTMGIVGYGSIGRQIGKLAQALGMKVLACKRTPDDKRDTGYCIPGTGDPEGRIPEAWFGTDELALMMSRSDVVVITLPLTPATIGLVGKRDLDSLPPHAYVVNVGRGAVLSETALIESLRTGRIAGAALDVFELEPLPAESPLWGLPNLLVMPHLASWTRQQSERAGEVLIENLSRDLQGLPLINVIDKSAMY